MRLNAEMREAILEEALSEAFFERDQALMKEESDLAHEVRNCLLGKYKEAFDSLPSGWIDESYKINASFAGNHDCLAFAEKKGDRYDAAKVAMPAFAKWHTVDATTFPRSHKLTKRWEVLTAESDKLADERRELTAKINALLKSISTVKQFLEVWPDGKKFLPDPVEKPSLPAVLGTEITDLIERAKAA